MVQRRNVSPALSSGSASPSSNLRDRERRLWKSTLRRLECAGQFPRRRKLSRATSPKFRDEERTPRCPSVADGSTLSDRRGGHTERVGGATVASASAKS